MKTAEEILKSKLNAELMLVNNADYTWNKILEAMEEYAAQFKQASDKPINYNAVPSDYDPHEVSLAKCDLCGYKWVAVRPEGLTKLECPNCGNMVNFENI